MRPNAEILCTLLSFCWKQGRRAAEERAFLACHKLGGKPVKHGLTDPLCTCHGKNLFFAFKRKQSAGSFSFCLFNWAGVKKKIEKSTLWKYRQFPYFNLDMCNQYQYKRCCLLMSISSVFLPKELLLSVVWLLQEGHWHCSQNVRKTERLSHISKLHTNIHPTSMHLV